MRPKRIDKLIKDMQSEPPSVRDIDAVRERVFSAVHEQSFHRGPSSFALRLGAGVGALALAFTGTVVAAQYAVPGDVLYPIKRAAESVWIGVQVSPEARIRTERSILERRFAETGAVRSDFGTDSPAIYYEESMRSAVIDLESAAGTADADVLSAEAELFFDLISAHAEDLDTREDLEDEALRARMEEAYLEGAIRANDAIITSAEIRDTKSVKRDAQ